MKIENAVINYAPERNEIWIGDIRSEADDIGSGKDQMSTFGAVYSEWEMMTDKERMDRIIENMFCHGLSMIPMNIILKALSEIDEWAERYPEFR